MVIQQYRAISNAVGRPLAKWWQRIGCYILTAGLCLTAVRIYWFWFYDRQYAYYVFRPRETVFPLGFNEWQWNEFELLLSLGAQLCAILLWLLPAALVARHATILATNLPHPNWPAFRQGLYLKLLVLGLVPFSLGLLLALSPMVMLIGEHNLVYMLQALLNCLDAFIAFLLVLFQPFIFVLAFAVLAMDKPMLFWLWAGIQTLGRPALMIVVAISEVAGMDTSLVSGRVTQFVNWFDLNTYMGFNWEIGAAVIGTMLLLLVLGKHRTAIWLWVVCLASAIIHTLEPLVYYFASMPGGNPTFNRIMLLLLGPSRFITEHMSTFDPSYRSSGSAAMILHQPIYVVKSSYISDSWQLISWLINLGWMAVCIAGVLLLLRIPVRPRE